MISFVDTSCCRCCNHKKDFYMKRYEFMMAATSEFSFYLDKLTCDHGGCTVTWLCWLAAVLCLLSISPLCQDRRQFMQTSCLVWVVSLIPPQDVHCQPCSDTKVVEWYWIKLIFHFFIFLPAATQDKFFTNCKMSKLNLKLAITWSCIS